jgi:hypothetical protein
MSSNPSAREKYPWEKYPWEKCSPSSGGVRPYTLHTSCTALEAPFSRVVGGWLVDLLLAELQIKPGPLHGSKSLLAICGGEGDREGLESGKLWRRGSRAINGRSLSCQSTQQILCGLQTTVVLFNSQQSQDNKVAMKTHDQYVQPMVIARERDRTPRSRTEPVIADSTITYSATLHLTPGIHKTSGCPKTSGYHPDGFSGAQYTNLENPRTSGS